MNFELGIMLESSFARAQGLAAFAKRAEDGGLDLVVITSDADAPTVSGLDPWTTAAWIAGTTDRIQIGIADDEEPPVPSDSTAEIPAVVAKARQTLDLLAGNRLIVGDDAWVTAPTGATPADLQSLAAEGLPVVVPVRTPQDVDRLAAIIADRDRTGLSRRSAAARSRRREGIDYDTVPESLRADLVEPGDDEYRTVRSNYLRGGSPGIVLRPRTPDQVADALGFARRHTHLPLGIRSGGHGVSGRSTNNGGVVIDVGRMDTIEILDPSRRLVRIGPGATWKQVAAALDPYGWALGSGDYGGVGVGGLATAGGIGLLSRKHGLTIDHLRAVELVLADGSQVRATHRDHPDLFWAVRGAGANFGVATAFEFEASDVGAVGWAKLVLVSTDIEDTLLRYGEIAGNAPRDTTVFLVTGPPRRGQSIIQLFGMVDSPDGDVIVERLTPFLEIGRLAQQEVVVTRYRNVMAEAHDVGPEGHHGGGEPISRSAFLPAITPQVAHDIAELLRSGLVYFFELRAMGGAIADVAPEESAFAHRTPAFQLTAMGGNEDAMNAAWDNLAEHFDGLYLSFDTDLRPERLNDAFPPAVLTRLRALKRRYDPANLFRDNFNIDPHHAPALAQVGEDQTHD